MNKEIFPYAVTITAPKEYPIEVHQGYLLDSKEQFICAMPKAGSTTGSWQSDGSKAGQGGDKIPYHLNLTYVAYAEKKFYKIDADLPADKILENFRKGFMVQGNVLEANNLYNLIPGTYDTFTVGAAPGGVVVVWLSGDHHRVEIGRFQAKEIFVDRNDFYDNPQGRTQQEFFDTMFDIEVKQDIQKSIKEKGIPFGLWDKYREKFKYRFVFKPYDEKDMLIKNANIYYNGEEEVLNVADLSKKEYKNLPIPQHSKLMFTIYGTDITFDDQELLFVFKNLQKKHLGKPMDILVAPTFMYNDFKLSVKCEEEIVPLSKYNIENIWGG
ncbi:DUF2931 family protein [Kaistella jeonii]|uniref:DUF2931 family protein n=1 Tax=Kaistella jeonii TaxID=266749 RepID=A0A0C1EX75_9FLAO|nr:DUF2931 family protein [Kaistella jeonii]KIA85467.1 hypothetical protein OA86_14550 [Kaistella jeonii]SFC41532.1 Protein of unknown function [Kaistella jeonii]VEI97323.1 Protein of uncharacterised function (DUF2931) [Kaistella jeonii]